MIGQIYNRLFGNVPKNLCVPWNLPNGNNGNSIFSRLWERVKYLYDWYRLPFYCQEDIDILEDRYRGRGVANPYIIGRTNIYGQKEFVYSDGSIA